MTMYRRHLRARRHTHACLTIAALLIGCPTPAAGIVYDAAADFSPTSNPNGVWSYGSTTSLGSTISVYDTPFSDPLGLDAWSSVAGGLPPSVVHNGTGAAITNAGDSITWLPGKLSFHPGPSNELSVVRWTAPAALLVDISSSFDLMDLQAVTVDVHVLLNSVSIYDSILSGFGGTDSFNTQVAVSAGDTIDFVVGYGNDNYFHDTTGLDAVITVVQSRSVPAVSGVGLFALTVGFVLAAALAGLQRRASVR